jgi:hypothetical protein
MALPHGQSSDGDIEMGEAESDDGSLFGGEVDPNEEPESEGLEYMQQEEFDQIQYEIDLQDQQQFDAELSRQEEEQAEQAAQAPQFQSQPPQNPAPSQTQQRSGQGQPSQQAPAQSVPEPSYQVSSTAHPLSVMWSTEENIAFFLHLILLLTFSRTLFYGAMHQNTPTDGRYSLPNTTYHTRE